MKNLFIILFLFLISIYSIGCDSSNSSTNSSDCPFLNQSLGCDGVCAENPLQNDACGICDGDGSTCDGLWNVFYDVDVPIAGFQFDVNEGNIINASGGAATEAGLSVSNSSSTVLAFSFSGATIPPGAGTLISLEITGDSNSFCIKDLVLSNISGDSIPAIIENCNTIIYLE
jgi:hypothetical protein